MVLWPGVRNVTRAGGGVSVVLLSGDMQKLERGALLLMLKFNAGLRRVPMTQLSGVSVRLQKVTSCLMLCIRNATRLNTFVIACVVQVIR